MTPLLFVLAVATVDAQPPQEAPTATDFYRVALELAETAEIALAQRDSLQEQTVRLTALLEETAAAHAKTREAALELRAYGERMRQRVVDAESAAAVRREQLDDLRQQRWLLLTGGVIAGALVTAGTIVLISR